MNATLNGNSLYERAGNRKHQLSMSKLDWAEERLVTLLRTPEFKDNERLEDAINEIQLARKEYIQRWLSA